MVSCSVNVLQMDDLDVPRNLRAATSPVVGGTAPSSPYGTGGSSGSTGMPYSAVLAQRKADAQKAATRQKVSKTSRHGWTDTTSTDEGTNASSNITSVGNKSDTKLNAKQLMRKYKSRVKPRTWLYLTFLIVSLPQHACARCCLRCARQRRRLHCTQAATFSSSVGR
jgi:hypothetical protein